MENEIKEEIIKIEQENFQKNRRLFKKYFLTLAVVFLILSSFYFGFQRGKSSAIQSEKNIPLVNSVIENKDSNVSNTLDFSLFWKVWDLLKEKHVNKNSLDAQQLMYGAIKGMLHATGDPYTNFFDPKETTSFSEQIAGSFEGIGAELGIKDNVLTIIAPLESSPAEKAGLRAGDKIVKIGNKMTSDMSIDEAVDLIRGKKGTQVTITIFREGESTTREVTITREQIEIKSVKWEIKDNNIAYIKINEFGETTADEFRLAATDIKNKNPKGIILDLRNNPGGFVDKCVDIASFFIPKGKVVVIEEDSAGKRSRLYTNGGDSLSGTPLVVLINEGSASASEILAGALHDDQGITLIGKKSFGKGSVQEFIKLPGGTSTKITVAKWLTPNGDYIMEKGITPDIEADLTLDNFKNGQDPQLDKAMEIIREKIK